MSWIRKNQYDESMKALLRATEPRTTSRVSVGAGSDQPAFPVWIFGAIIASGIIGGAASGYFEKMSKRGWQ
jgi:hypothetical protein